jgi:hypothetical protein
MKLLFDRALQLIINERVPQSPRPAGGAARAAALSPKKRKMIAKKAALATRLAVFRALMIPFESSQLSLRKGGMSVMRYELNPLNKAMIGALQDCLLSARPR